MSLSVFYFRSFNLFLRRLSPFLLFYVLVSRPFHLLEFYPNWALAVGMHGHHVLLRPALVKNHQNILKRIDVNIPLFSAIWAPPAAIKWTLPSWRTPEITCRTSEISSSVRHITFMAFWKKIKISSGTIVHENELYSKIAHKLLAKNFTIWPNSNSQKNYQANSKTINQINENCLSVQVLPSSKLFWLIFFNTRVFNLGPCKFPSHFIQSGLDWVP